MYMGRVAVMIFTALAGMPGLLFAQPLESKCRDLRNIVLSEVEISESKMNPASADGLPAHCMVRGTIEKRTGRDGRQYGMGFELRMPEKWEQRFLFQGGGGMDGMIRPALGSSSGADKTPGLARGFAVAATDGGHQGSGPNPMADASFGRDQQARIDNAYRSIERVTEVSRELVRQFYGEAWKHSYIAGCSNGGRQGLMAAQRFPRDFDGIVSGAPAFRVTHAAIGNAWETILFSRIAPADAEGKPILSQAYSDADLKLVADAILKQCDESDGAKDGLVMNTAACNFDPVGLSCSGEKTPACLAPAQVAILKMVFDGPRNSKGEELYSDWPWDPGIASAGWRMLKLGTSKTAVPNSAGVTLMLSGLKGYFMTPYDPDFDPMKYDFDRDPARVEETAALQDPTGTQLSTFIERGGKLILYHGMADPFFSANDTIRYYKALVKDNADVRPGPEWARLFLVPGMTHCAGGGLDNFDALTAIVNWVEKGEAPSQLPATGAGFPGITRPLCPYPAYAKQSADGNFTCAAP